MWRSLRFTQADLPLPKIIAFMNLVSDLSHCDSREFQHCDGRQPLQLRPKKTNLPKLPKLPEI